MLSFRVRYGERTILVVLSDEVEASVNAASFRGTDVSVAGNFSRWSSVQEMLKDKYVQMFLRGHMKIMLNQQIRSKLLTIAHHFPVGWSLTAPAQNYAPEDLESFWPTPECEALRVKPSRRDLPAPKTNKSTFLLRHRRTERADYIHIDSLYPGEPAGKMEGNVTASGLVFFEQGHPGE